MTGFKHHLTSSLYNKALPDASVSAVHEETTLYLRLDSRDVIVAASYEGAKDLWLSSLCELLKDMPLAEAKNVSLSHWDNIWGHDQFYWDMKLEISDRIFFQALELLHTAIDLYVGREFLYKEESPLICRCFGVREKDVVAFLNSANDTTMEELSKITKAGMGCRSCVPQLKDLLKIPGEEKKRFYKERPVVQWIEEIENALKMFPYTVPWKMHVQSMKGNVVMIAYEFEADQKQEEEVGRKIQGFLGGAVDADLAFFLARSRQR